MSTLLCRRSYLFWRIAQALVFLLGLAIIVALFWWPEVGLLALWSVLIPVAPLLLVLAPGIWRNICPLASAALFPRHMGFSAHRQIPVKAQGWLALTGLTLLLLIVPLRHTVLDTNGPVTAAVLVAVGLLAFGMGTAFEWKSGWCSGLCPVHPVEKLYGSRPALSVPNAHCTQCQRCSAVCPDSTPAMQPMAAPATLGHLITGLVLVGGFPGFVWGWFQVSDHVGSSGAALARAYAFPFLSLAFTLLLYMALRAALGQRLETTLVRVFAAAAVSCYYWYRLPMLIGLGERPGEGQLVDLSASLPLWTTTALHVASTAFFLWWLVLRPAVRRSWAIRPPYAVALPQVSVGDSPLRR